MPTPSDPQPVPLHGGTNAGVGPLRVCAFGEGAGGEQHLHGGRVIFAHGNHQRRLLELRLARVHARAALDEQRAARPGLPVRAAVISAVSPPASTALGSAPASSRRRIMSALPLTAARYSGVTP